MSSLTPIPSAFHRRFCASTILSNISHLPTVLLNLIADYETPLILVVATGYHLKTFVAGEENPVGKESLTLPASFYTPVSTTIPAENKAVIPTPHPRACICQHCPSTSHITTTHATTHQADKFITDVITTEHGYVVTSSHGGRITIWDMSKQTMWNENGKDKRKDIAAYPSQITSTQITFAIPPSTTSITNTYTSPNIHALLALSNGHILAGSSHGQLHLLSHDHNGIIHYLTSSNNPTPRETVCSMIEIENANVFRYMKPYVEEKDDGTGMTDIPSSAPPSSFSDEPAPSNAIYIISACESHVLKLWRILPDKIELLRKIQGHSGGVICLSHMSNGRICSGSWDKSIRIWDVTSPSILPLATITGGHTQLISALTVIRDDTSGHDIIISGSMDKSIRVWSENKQTHQWVALWEQKEAATTIIRSLKTTLDGTAVFASSNDGSVTAWPVSRLTGRLGSPSSLIPPSQDTSRVYLTLAPEPHWAAILKA